MLKNVNKATPEYATSETLVWWDMDNCPLPNGYDTSRLGPRIDTELKNLGYNGPLTIIAVGNLDGIPSEFLNALASDGFVIKHSGEGMFSDMLEYFISRNKLLQPPPVTIMIISGDHGLLESAENLKTQEVVSSLSKNSTSKTKKAKKLEVEKEFESKEQPK